MKINRLDVLTGLFFVSLMAYLFVSAPEPVSELKTSAAKTIPVNTMFEIVAQENNRIRKLWTQKIVGSGKKAGLKFGENWQNKQVQAGPLPALFLREVAMNLEKSPIPLSLFLGSDYPISSSNTFKGRQKKYFETLRETSQPQFFYAEDIKRFTAMFPDTVSVNACADCHNKHPDSPKKDWQMNDIMGATTWAYPDKNITQEELLEIISELRTAFVKAYDSFIAKARTFEHTPVIGNKWPEDGYFIPATDVFIKRFEQEASPESMAMLLKRRGRQKYSMKTASDH